MAYTPTNWINDTPPPLSAVNLNKLTDELQAQAAADGIANSLPNWVDGAAPALTDAAPLNEMERVAQAVASVRGSSYTPTVWSSGWVPTRNAARLNQLEQRVAANSLLIPVPPVVTGDKFASPTGSDTTGTGTLANPYKSPQKLSESLAPGQVGMLRGGTYGALSGGNPGMQIHANGTAGNPVTITNYPGERVLLQGLFGIWGGGSYITVRNLHFDTTNNQRPDHGCGISAQPLDIEGGTDIIFEYNEIFQSGNAAYPSNLKNSGIFQSAGTRTIIRYNIIRDVGGCQALDHGIYLGHANASQVYGNWIWTDAHGWGIQVYPDVQNSVFHSNVIYNCGSGFVMQDDAAGGLQNNDVYNNVVMGCHADNSAGQFGDRSKSSGAGLSGGGPNGSTNNKFRDNIIWDCPGGIAGEIEPYWGHGNGIINPPANVTITGNVITNPLFVNAAAHDFRLQAGSPAAGFGLPNFIPGPTV